MDSFSVLLQIKMKNLLYTTNCLFQCVSKDNKRTGFIWYVPD